MHTISPELVLVDPELARTERARLAAPGLRAAALRLEPDPPSRAAAQTEVVPSRRETIARWARAALLPAALLVSLFGNGLLTSVLLLHTSRPAGAAVPVSTAADIGLTVPRLTPMEGPAPPLPGAGTSVTPIAPCDPLAPIAPCGSAHGAASSP